MRHARRIAALLGVCLLALIIAQVPGAEQRLEAAQPGLSPRVYLPLQVRQWRSEPPVHSAFGVSDSPSFAVSSSPQALNLFTSAGMVYNRTSVLWSLIEPTNTTPDQYDWSTADAAINRLLNQQIEPFVLILRNPTWAATTDCGPIHNPDDLSEFVGAVVARYPRVKYWGLYNEVDGSVYSIYHGSSGGCFGEDDLDENGTPDYADYAELMRVTWSAMHTANPNAQLVFGILAFDNFKADQSPPAYPGGCCFNYHFLDNLLGYLQAHPLPPEAQDSLVLGFNNYLAYDLSYWEYNYPSVGVGAKILALREAMERHGMNFPMVITEMSGWPTLPSVEGVPEETQARQLAQMYTESLFYDIRVLMWWPWSDYPDTNCNVNVPCDVFKYGVVTRDQTPKQSYFALKTLIAELRGYTPLKSAINETVVDFTFKKGKQRKHVVFARSNTFDNPTVEVVYDADRVRVVDMLGKRKTIAAGEKGKVKLDVSANPVYVEINPK